MFRLKKEAEEFRRGEWEVNCVGMTLTQNGVDTPAQFVGQGYLRQKEGGTIHYQLYPTTVIGVDSTTGFHPIGVPGVVIEPHRFYRLDAVAQDGISWLVENHPGDGWQFP